MAKSKIEKDPTILEAVDNLSSMAELNVNEIATNQKKGVKTVNTLRWLDTGDEKRTLEAVQSTLKVVLNYLKQIHLKEADQLKSTSFQKGIISIMNLAQEAVDKVDAYGKQCKKKINISNSKEYIALIEFYHKSIKTRFEKDSKDADGEIEEEVLSDGRTELKDLEAVKRDDDYELFYLQKENGGKFYNPNLSRHIRLVGEFDQIITEFTVFDPLTKVPLLKDDIAFHLCKQMRDRLKLELDSVIKGAGNYRDDSLVQNVFQAMMALLLSSNAKNQLKITTGKSVSGYFKDFQMNLRAALSSIDYRNYIDFPPVDEFYSKVLNLLHSMCYVMYTSHINTTESGSLLSLMIGQGKNITKTSKRSSVALWNTILDDYEILTSVFNSCPNGPLFKILDIINQEEMFSEFDPILQGDFPGNYFSMRSDIGMTQFLKIPSPTIQSTIDEATISFEFKGFLRSLVFQQKKMLLFNFQDKTSWKEYARAHVIEEQVLDAEVGEAVTIISFPKSTYFYLQSEDYLKVDGAEDFKKIFFKQVEGEGACGFLFPKKTNRASFHSFVKRMIEDVHKTFFSSKKTLSRKNRLDFIEIGYHLMMLYFIKEEKAEYTAFSAKDGVDVSAITLGSMFGFLKTLSGEMEWKVEDEDFFIETIYSSALIVRERAPQVTVLNRAVGMLVVVTAEVELDKKKIVKILKNLFDNSFSSMAIKKAS